MYYDMCGNGDASRSLMNMEKKLKNAERTLRNWGVREEV
jgi:hypothetical protein